MVQRSVGAGTSPGSDVLSKANWLPRDWLDNATVSAGLG
jgi:hypothetical protein